jgi:hypothetical protein
MEFLFKCLVKISLFCQICNKFILAADSGQLLAQLFTSCKNTELFFFLALSELFFWPSQDCVNRLTRVIPLKQYNCTLTDDKTPVNDKLEICKNYNS